MMIFASWDGEFTPSPYVNELHRLMFQRPKNSLPGKNNGIPQHPDVRYAPSDPWMEAKIEVAAAIRSAVRQARTDLNLSGGYYS